MRIIAGWLLLPLVSGISIRSSRVIKMGLNNDLSAIQKYQSYFRKETFNDIIGEITDHKLSRILVNTDYRTAVTVDKLVGGVEVPSDDLIYNHYHISAIDPAVVPTLVQTASTNHIPIHFVNFTPESILNVQTTISQFLGFTSYFFPLFILFSLFATFNSINRITGGNNKSGLPFSGRGNNGILGFGNDEEQYEFIKPNVSLSNWAGSQEVIEECRDVISYLENKEIYKEVGAVMPKGILLEGPPGTGKTLLAKAIATETNSTFISKSASEFVELFVGMGAAKVRELFELARENSPAIIFIDEIDAVGKQRGASLNAANDEREQTLNQLLYEMDGFNQNEDIVVMAATNRKDILDKALLRPGRFDRIIRIPLPDQDSRQKILEYYLSSKRVEGTVDVSTIAELTAGLSGAELKNLVNEAAITTAKNRDTTIKEQYILDSFEKSVVGLVRRNATSSPVTKQRVAIHEIGHTLLALKYPEYFDFKKVSIQSTYNGAGGYTLFSEKPDIKEGGLYTKDILKKRLIVTLGGKAAETIYYGDEFVSLGATQDLSQANRLAKRMIGSFGMGIELEVFHDGGDEDEAMNPFRGNTISENTKNTMDGESLDLVNEAFYDAKEILRKNRETMMRMAEVLKARSVLTASDFDQVFLI
jgi:cell division protease FtsH